MHSVGFKKRASAYLLDIVLFMAVFMFIAYLIPESANVAVLNKEFNELNDLLFSNQISFFKYIYRISSVMQDLDKERMLYSIINVIYIIIYFVIIPFKTKRTLGMYLMRIHYDKKEGKVSLDDLLIRSMITCGLLYSLITLVIIYLVPGLAYFIISVFLAILQISLVIISIFMVIYRRDHKGLQDLLSKTIIVND